MVLILQLQQMDFQNQMQVDLKNAFYRTAHSLCPLPKNQYKKSRRCRGGGIGRRWGLKIPCPNRRAGSSPALGTRYSFLFPPLYRAWVAAIDVWHPRQKASTVA